MILSLHHMSIPMPQGREAEGIAFYSGLLGLKRAPKPEPMGTQGAWFECPDGRQVHLVVSNPFVPFEEPHPAFYTSDFDNLARTLEDSGHLWEPDSRWPGVRRAFTRDPFGNRVEFLDSSSGLLTT